MSRPPVELIRHRMSRPPAPNNTTMRPIMEILRIFFYKLELIALIIFKKFGVLNCSLLSHKYKTLNPDISKEALSVTVTSPGDLSILIDYFNKYPLWGTKGKDFKDWEKILINLRFITFNFLWAVGP